MMSLAVCQRDEISAAGGGIKQLSHPLCGFHTDTDLHWKQMCTLIYKMRSRVTGRPNHMKSHIKMYDAPLYWWHSSVLLKTKCLKSFSYIEDVWKGHILPVEVQPAYISILIHQLIGVWVVDTCNKHMQSPTMSSPLSPRHRCCRDLICCPSHEVSHVVALFPLYLIHLDLDLVSLVKPNGVLRNIISNEMSQ